MREQVDTLGDGRLCELTIPFRWHVLEADESPRAAGERAARNLRVLEVIAALQSPADAGFDDESLEQAFSRLNFKLDVVLELVSELALRQGGIAARASLCIGWRNIVWPASEPPEVGAAVMVELWPHPVLARSCAFTGRVIRVGGQTSGETEVEVRLDRMNDALKAAWERFVFRQHRLQVAREKADA